MRPLHTILWFRLRRQIHLMRNAPKYNLLQNWSWFAPPIARSGYKKSRLHLVRQNSPSSISGNQHAKLCGTNYLAEKHARLTWPGLPRFWYRTINIQNFLQTNDFDLGKSIGCCG